MENISTSGARHVDDVRVLNRNLTERALYMRAVSYIAGVKAKLLTETIFEMDQSKKSLLLINRDIVHQKETIANQNTLLQEKNDELEENRESLKRVVRERESALEEKKRLMGEVKSKVLELEEANAKLTELDHLKSMFVASMSHELRTPLNSIIGFTGLILNGMTGEINDEQKDQLQRVYSSANHLLNLITDIIDISKIEAGKVEPFLEECNLFTTVTQAVQSLQTQVDKKPLVVEVAVPSSMQVQTDERRLLQCLLNFVSNAIKYSEKGTIQIDAQEDENSVTIRVKDTGIGIRESDLSKLFVSFERLDSPLKNLNVGTGLGLYLTKKIATDILQGSLAVESQYGVGSTFFLSLPKVYPLSLLHD